MPKLPKNGQTLSCLIERMFSKQTSNYLLLSGKDFANQKKLHFWAYTIK